jgi:CBS domain-containing protein
MTVAAILRHKGYQVLSVSPRRSIAEVVQVLSSHCIGAVIVKDLADQLIGLVSERAIVNSLAANGIGTLAMTAGQLMTRDLKTVTPHTTEAEAMMLMTIGRSRYLPVLEDGVLIGMISIGDVVKARIMQAEQDVDSLRTYVAYSA